MRDAVLAHAGFLAAETLAVHLDVRPLADVTGPAHPLGDKGTVKLALRTDKLPAA